MADPIDFRPGIVNFFARAGDDISLTVTFPYDTTGGTHEMLIAASPSGAPVLTLTNGSGLTVTNGATSSVAVAISKTFTGSYAAGTVLYYDYKLTLGTKKTKLSGSITLAAGIPG